MHRVRYRINMLLVWMYVAFKHLTGNPWKKVKGVWMPLRRDIGFNTLRWIVNGRYEEAEIEIVSRNISKEDKVLEIGTGLGFVSSYCCKRIGSERVYSFEANPNNIDTATSVFKKNDVHPFLRNAILGASEGVIQFPVNKKSLLASSLFQDNGDVVEVPIINLNQVISEIKPTFLVIDIEGAEYDIFKLIEFQTIKKIQVELHPDLLGKEKTVELFSILKQNEFEIGFSHSDQRNYFFYRK
jgi:FkbM family methyltransferase